MCSISFSHLAAQKREIFTSFVLLSLFPMNSKVFPTPINYCCVTIFLQLSAPYPCSTLLLLLVRLPLHWHDKTKDRNFRKMWARDTAERKGTREGEQQLSVNLLSIVVVKKWNLLSSNFRLFFEVEWALSLGLPDRGGGFKMRGWWRRGGGRVRLSGKP